MLSSPQTINRKGPTLISAENICYYNAHSYLFEKISLVLCDGEKVGLIGHNGCGKSTLLSIISMRLNTQSGQVAHANSLKFYFVEQDFPESLEKMTIIEAILSALPPEIRPESRWKTDSILTKVGLNELEGTLSVNNLSGGQKTKILLARALITEPNMLILDEPSNHLDLPTLLWLEQFLLSWKGCLVIVSHDSRLLDKVTNSSWIIANKKLHRYGYGCSKAVSLHKEYENSLREKVEIETQEIKRLETSANTLAMWGKNYDSMGLSRKAKSMFKRIDKLQSDLCQVPDEYPWQLSFPGQTLPANRVLEITETCIKPDNNGPDLFKISAWQVKSGDRVAILGANGKGKSSFLRLLWKYWNESTEEQIYFHPKATVAYYDQMLEGFDNSLQLIEALQFYCKRSAVNVNTEMCKLSLIKTGFSYNRLQQQVKSLSGGERARLMLLGLSLINSHILMLDEPTNHIDLIGKQELEKQIQNYPGALLLVSHDRDLIEATCNRFMVIYEKQWVEFNDIQLAYDYINNTTSNTPLVKENKSNQLTPDNKINEDKLLERLVEVEALLEKDLQRKPKHQKPNLQQEWLWEIEQLQDSLGLKD